MVAHTTREFHLRASLPEQYARYMWRLVAHQSAGSPGYRYRDVYGPQERPGLADSGVLAREAIPPTLSVVIPTLLLSLGVAALAGHLLSEETLATDLQRSDLRPGRARACLRRPVPLLLPRLQVGSGPVRQLLQLLRVEFPRRMQRPRPVGEAPRPPGRHALALLRGGVHADGARGPVSGRARPIAASELLALHGACGGLRLRRPDRAGGLRRTRLPDSGPRQIGPLRLPGAGPGR